VFINYTAMGISSSRSSYRHVKRHAQPEAATALPNVYNWEMTRSTSPSRAQTILRPSNSYGPLACIVDDQVCEPRTGKRPVRGIGRRGDGTIQATVYTRRREWRSECPLRGTGHRPTAARTQISSRWHQNRSWRGSSPGSGRCA
jgi:hypothetical protein